MAVNISPIWEKHAISEIVVSFYLDSTIPDLPEFASRLNPGKKFSEIENVLVLQPTDTVYIPYQREDLISKRNEFTHVLSEKLLDYFKRHAVSKTFKSLNSNSVFKVEFKNMFQNGKERSGVIEIHYSQPEYKFSLFLKEISMFLKNIAKAVSHKVDAVSMTYMDVLKLTYDTELDLKEVLNYGSRKLPEQFFSRFLEEIDFKGGGFLNREGSKVERYSVQVEKSDSNQSNLTILHLMGFDDKEDVPFEGTVKKFLDEIINEARYSNRAFLNEILTIKATEAINLPKL